MILYVLRHAIAMDRAQWRKADSDRPLTKEGVKKMERIAEGMKSIGISFDWMLTSPFRRAFDTAAIVAKEFKAAKKQKTTTLLAPDGDPQALVRHLARDYKTWETVLLVGHDPYLSRLVSLLVSGTPDASVELKKGGLCRLEADSLTFGRCATLSWLFPPKLLRAL